MRRMNLLQFINIPLFILVNNILNSQQLVTCSPFLGSKFVTRNNPYYTKDDQENAIRNIFALTKFNNSG